MSTLTTDRSKTSNATDVDELPLCAPTAICLPDLVGASVSSLLLCVLSVPLSLPDDVVSASLVQQLSQGDVPGVVMLDGPLQSLPCGV